MTNSNRAVKWGEVVLVIYRKQYREIVEHAINAAPKEACGLIAGLEQGERRTVAKVYPLTNLDDSPDHYAMDPKEQFAAVRDMRANGLVLLGNYHSHPASPARPSAEDIRLAFDPGASYLILSLLESNNPVLRGFSIIKDIVSEEAISIVEDK